MFMFMFMYMLMMEKIKFNRKLNIHANFMMGTTFQ